MRDQQNHRYYHILNDDPIVEGCFIIDSQEAEKWKGLLWLPIRPSVYDFCNKKLIICLWTLLFTIFSKKNKKNNFKRQISLKTKSYNIKNNFFLPETFESVRNPSKWLGLALELFRLEEYFFPISNLSRSLFEWMN